MKKIIDFFISTIISGLLWDLLKSNSIYTLKEIQKKFFLWRINEDDAKSIREFLSLIKEENLQTRYDLQKFLNRNEFYKSNILGGIFQNNSRNIGNININRNFGKIVIYNNNKVIYKSILLVLLLVLIFVLLIFFIQNHFNPDNTKKEQAKEYLNQYVIGKYEGLCIRENIPTLNQNMDTVFYKNEESEKQGNYVRVLQYSMYYDFSQENIDDFIDVYESVLISTCQEYNNAMYKIGDKNLFDSWEFLDDTGVYIDFPYSSGEKDYPNTLIYKYSDGIIIEKCLYFGEKNIITVILSSSEKNYEDMLKSEEMDLLLKCFKSFNSIYKK